MQFDLFVYDLIQVYLIQFVLILYDLIQDDLIHVDCLTLTCGLEQCVAMTTQLSANTGGAASAFVFPIQ